MAGAEVSSAAGLHPAAVTGLQYGRTLNERHRLTVNVATRSTLGPTDEVANFSGAGNRELIAMSIGYAGGLGGGWGLGTSFDTGAAVGSVVGGGVVPVYVEHSGG